MGDKNMRKRQIAALADDVWKTSADKFDDWSVACAVMLSTSFRVSVAVQHAVEPTWYPGV